MGFTRISSSNKTNSFTTRIRALTQTCESVRIYMVISSSLNSDRITEEMKLRIRRLGWKQTKEISIPSHSSLQCLKETIAHEFLSSPSHTLHLSLNRKDEILTSSATSLNSYGLNSGDLIYYTQNPNAFSAGDQETLEIMKIPGNPSLALLRKVYVTEVGAGNVNVYSEGDCRLLIIAIHAMLLESGFVCFDSLTQKVIKGHGLPEEWLEKSRGVLRLEYTALHVVGRYSEGLRTVELEFHVGSFMVLRRSLSKRNLVNLFKIDTTRFIPCVKCVCMNNEMEESVKVFAEKEVFELWKIVKDGIGLRLLVDLFGKSSSELPSRLTRLPTDLMIKILEFLPGSEIANVARVSTELGYLSSNNDLWKLKCMEEFPRSRSEDMEKDNWKKNYASLKKKQKKRKRNEVGSSEPCVRPFPIRERRYDYPMTIENHDSYPKTCQKIQDLRFCFEQNFIPYSDHGSMVMDT